MNCQQTKRDGGGQHNGVEVFRTSPHTALIRAPLKSHGTCAETRFILAAKPSSPFELFL